MTSIIPPVMIIREFLIQLHKAGITGMPDRGPRQIHLSPLWKFPDLEMPFWAFSQKFITPMVEWVMPYKVLGKAPGLPARLSADITGFIEPLGLLELRYLEAFDCREDEMICRIDFTTNL